MTDQLRLDDVEVAEGRLPVWVSFGPAGRRALGRDRPGARPRERDSRYSLDNDPARGCPATNS